MNPTHVCDGFLRLTEINIPGVYQGKNTAFIKDMFPEMYKMYEQGHENKAQNREYPQFMNNPHGNNIRLHLNPMVCKHHNPKVKVDIVGGEITTPA